MPYIGQSLKRFEDPKLLTGQGSFVDDIQLPDMLHVAILRSPHAHARIRAIDITAARNTTGVVAVLTGADIAGVLGDVPTRAMVGGWEVDDLKPVEQPVLAQDKVYYVGQPVAIVVAQSRYLAKDAVALHGGLDMDGVAARVKGEQVFLPLRHPFDGTSQSRGEIRNGNVFRKHTALLTKATPNVRRQHPHPALRTVQELGHIVSDVMRGLGRVPHG